MCQIRHRVLNCFAPASGPILNLSFDSPLNVQVLVLAAGVRGHSPHGCIETCEQALTSVGDPTDRVAVVRIAFLPQPFYYAGLLEHWFSSCTSAQLPLAPLLILAGSFSDITQNWTSSFPGTSVHQGPIVPPLLQTPQDNPSSREFQKSCYAKPCVHLTGHIRLLITGLFKCHTLKRAMPN